MSIDIEAKLIYGLYYKDVPEDILDDINEMIDDEVFDYASPYYDAPRCDWIIGVGVIAQKKRHYSLGYEISNIHEEVPVMLIRDDIELLMYVTPHVS